MKNLFVRTALCAALLAFGAAAANAQGIEERTIGFGRIDGTDHPVRLGEHKFAELPAATGAIRGVGPVRDPLALHTVAGAPAQPHT